MLKVTIITATYNSALTIEDTIQSVIRQDYKNIEHIIIDGDSQDDTLAIVEKYKDKISRVISEKDKGIYDAMNKGIRLAQGDIIGILNSDDFFTESTIISSIVKAFEEDLTLDGVHGDLYYVKQNNPNQIVRHWVSSEFKPRSFFSGWHPAHPTLYLRRAVYEKYGLFDLNFPVAADFELMLRLFECEEIRTKYLHIPMIRMRLGGASNKNYTNLVNNTSECIKAFRKNNLHPPLLYPLYRLVPKMLQYFK